MLCMYIRAIPCWFLVSSTVGIPTFALPWPDEPGRRLIHRSSMAVDVGKIHGLKKSTIVI